MVGRVRAGVAVSYKESALDWLLVSCVYLTWNQEEKKRSEQSDHADVGSA